MKSIQAVIGGALVSATLLLTGCGGGSIDVLIDVPPVAVANFDVIMYANGKLVAGVEVFPGETQTVILPVGQSFKLDSSGPVAWSVAVGGSNIVGAGNTIYYGNTAVQETLRTNAQYAANTFATAPLAGPVMYSFFATSLRDSYQTARINVVLN
jgi:hypothetical protein